MVLQLDGVVWGTTAICLGETVIKFDTQLAAFQPALALTNLFLWESNYTREVLILNNTKSAVPKAVDTRPGPDQPSSLDTTWCIKHILHEHTNCSLRFTWGKRADAQAAYKHAKTLVFNTVKDPFNLAHELSTINFQHTQAKAKATCKWEELWHADPQTSLAYCTACSSPPDRKLHPILQAHKKGWSIKDTCSRNDQPTKAKATHADTSTLIRFATGHAFTGEYAACFLRGKFPHLSPEELAVCLCSE